VRPRRHSRTRSKPGSLGRLGQTVACLAAVGSLTGLAAQAARAVPAGVRPPPPRFAWLVPTSAPASWGFGELPGSTAQATIAYPPSFSPITGDTGTVSFASRTANGAIRAYLNVTPRQGAERPHGFARFRVRLLGSDDDRDVQQEAAAEGLTFRGGHGSCVMDRYVTRVGHHHYREIACLVAGAHTSAVVVGAAATSAWSEFESQLQLAIASFTIS
jgi:hypothetical protein